ncbi:MAG: class I SAM-dependent methyltransferase [Methanosarcinales archaeon]|nr:class I SAM-dependent methyltransferase [Methanosarcinales archaeon]
MREEESVCREQGIHGERWRTIHDGYFADPVVAGPFVEAIARVVDISHPAAIADLGGGTGFVLGEILRRADLPGMRLVDLDVSPRQLSTGHDGRIEMVQGSASQFERRQIVSGEGRLQLIARSLLHYFGRQGIREVLRHIRLQLRSGEFFVHQSACFLHSVDAECLNLIYELIGTDKWYFTVGEMEEMLKDEGWKVCSVCPAPALHLSSPDLSERYALAPDQVEMIRARANGEYGQRPEVFTTSGRGFDAWLHYYIFVCRAL